MTFKRARKRQRFKILDWIRKKLSARDRKQHSHIARCKKEEGRVHRLDQLRYSVLGY